jgi:type IV secretory pathway TrbL component
MNREALPLIIAILAPVVIVFLILLYFYGYDFTLYLRRIDLIYYIILFPFGLGLAIAFLRRKKQ